MVTAPALNDRFKRVLETTSIKLAPLGFVRHGTVLRMVRYGNTAIIEFQKSTKSSRNHLLFTVNLAVVCGHLIEQNGRTPNTVRSTDAQFRERIGMLLPGRPDKWWQIDETAKVESLAEEVSELIAEVAVPHIEAYLDERNLIDLWQSGKSPGLTELQRERCLESLRNKLTSSRESG